MKRWKLALPVALAVVALPVFAGADCEKDGAKALAAGYSGKKCSMSAAECKQMMAAKRTQGWMGVELAQESDALTVMKVVAGSPAEKAGIREGDVFVAFNGVTISPENHEKLAAMRKDLKPGDAVTYVVKRDGTDRNVKIKLGTMPEAVYTAWIEKHIKEDHPEVASR